MTPAQTLLIVAKLLAVIAWPWWVVLLPLEVFAATIYVLVVISDLREI